MSIRRSVSDLQWARLPRYLRQTTQASAGARVPARCAVCLSVILLTLTLTLTLTLALGAVDARGAELGSLEHCIRLKQKIDKYTQLRRAGGNAQQMERWRTARRRYEEQFTDLRCRRFGRKLRAAD